MNGKELVRTMLRLFFPIWGVVFIMGVANMLVLDYILIGFGYITMLMVIALSMTFSIAVHYSKNDLSKNQMIMRYVVHAIVTSIILVACLAFAWSNFQWSYVFFIVPIHLVGYCIIVGVDEMHTKRLLSKFREASK